MSSSNLIWICTRLENRLYDKVIQQHRHFFTAFDFDGMPNSSQT